MEDREEEFEYGFLRLREELDRRKGRFTPEDDDIFPPLAPGVRKPGSLNDDHTLDV